MVNTSIELSAKPGLPFGRSKLYWLNERAIVLEIVDDPSMHEQILARQQYIWRLADNLGASCLNANALTIVDIVPGNQNLTIVFGGDDINHAVAQAFIEQQWAHTTNTASMASSSKAHDECIEIPVIYGGAEGPDLNDVAQHHHLTTNEVIRHHSATLYTVLFLGFQPGFAYLHGLPDILITPRKQTPRLQVGAGSVGIGGRQTGIYPQASPGGWQIIGRMVDTTNPLFDIQRAAPCLLRPGQQLRFVAV